MGSTGGSGHQRTPITRRLSSLGKLPPPWRTPLPGVTPTSRTLHPDPAPAPPQHSGTCLGAPLAPCAPPAPGGGKSVCEPTPEFPGADTSATRRALSRRKQAHHVHDGEDELLGCFRPWYCTMSASATTRVSTVVLTGQPDGAPPLPIPHAWPSSLLLF